MKKNYDNMVLVPAGPFIYGSREDDLKAGNEEKPQRTIDLPAFYMDIFPVTNKQYAKFLNQIRFTDDTVARWIDLTESFLGEKCRIVKRLKWIYVSEKGKEHYPVTCVSWYGAEAYTMWAGKRLPLEEEWEKSARGTDGRIYPWGNEPDNSLCNTRESEILKTSQVDRFSKGKSPYGCFDMAGNVLEWTDSWRYDHREEKNRSVLLGGSWHSYQYGARCACRIFSSFPKNKGCNIGFRCAKTA